MAGQGPAVPSADARLGLHLSDPLSFSLYLGDGLIQTEIRLKELFFPNIINKPMSYRGWSGGAKVLSKLSVPGRPTSLDDSRVRAYCACSRCGRGLFGHFLSHLSFLFSFSLSLGDGPI